MLRIFLTGDNHIGLKYLGSEQAEKLVQKRVSAFEQMVRKANEEKSDLFVISGDLFDKTTGITKRVIRELLGYLSEFAGTVVVLPGNHDYYDEEAKVWQDFQEEMSRYDNILLLTEYRPYELSVDDRAAVLYPAFCTSRSSEPGKNNLGWIKKTVIVPDGRYHIGIAHGAITGETIDQDEVYFQMSPDELAAIPVDVWLIGHTHVPVPRNLTDEYREAGRIFNAGTHVQKDVHNNSEGQCFIIEIGDDKKIRAKKMISGNVRFWRLPVAVTAGHMEEELNRAVKDLGDESVVELQIRGAVTDGEYRNRNSFLEGLMKRFIKGSWTDAELSRLITGDLIDREFPETSFAAGLLKSLLDEPAEAQLAYDLLKKMKGGR